MSNGPDDERNNAESTKECKASYITTLDWILKDAVTNWFSIPEETCNSVDVVEACGPSMQDIKTSNHGNDRGNAVNVQTECTTNIGMGAILRQLRSNPSVVDTYKSTTLVHKKSDHHSIGSETMPDSDDEIEETKEGFRNVPRRTWIFLYVGVAVLASVALALGLAIFVKNKADKKSTFENSLDTNGLTDREIEHVKNTASDHEVPIARSTVPPTPVPSQRPTLFPTTPPVPNPTFPPTPAPTPPPTLLPSNLPTLPPTPRPTPEPTPSPTFPPTTFPPTSFPTSVKSKDAAGSAGKNYDYTSNTDYLVGVYYYPWHGEDFHKGGGYLRRELIPPQQPTLGEYNDSDPQVIAQHMKWFRQANIGLLVTSWWGPNRLEDKNTKNVIMGHEDIGNLKIALFYETTGRIKENDDMSNPRSDIQYICSEYFDHPNYYKIDGRPVLVVYVTRKLHNDGILEEALLTMRSEASKCGHNIYLIGDQVFSSAPDPDEVFVPFWYFDAVTNYDVYGSSGRPNRYAGKDAVDKYYSQQEQWKERAFKENCRYVPPVSPGYNDRGVRLENDHPPLSRRLTADSEEGSLFWYQLKRALSLVDPLVDNLILVNSFNEWHEDTQIEPAVGITSNAVSTEPELLTGGLEYIGYGELYLDILGAATSKYEGAKVFDALYGGYD